jgi:hypothetical protein
MFAMRTPIASLTQVSAAALAGLAAVSLLVDAARAQQVGTAAAVNPAAQARGSGGARTIVLGQSIAHKERIQTTSAGSVQLLFLDKTSMTIGPNSDLAIDEYVYDPSTNTGKLAATLSKGVMRFVGGQISHAGNAQVTTPTAVVGVRGGVAIFQPSGVFIGYGEGEVRSGGSTVTLGAGEYTQTPGGGAPPSDPRPPPANFLTSVLATLQSRGPQGGGAPVSAANVNSARTSATGTSSGNIANANSVAANTASQQTVSTIAAAQQVQQVVQSVQSVTQTTVAQEEVQRINEEIRRRDDEIRRREEETRRETERRRFSATAFAFTTTNCCSPNNPTSIAPYLPPQFAQGGNFYISPVVGYRLASVDNPNRGAFFQYGINITGQGANQNSWIFINQGAFLDDGAGGLQSIAGVVGSRRGAANMFPGFLSAANSSISGTLTLDLDGIPSRTGTNQAYWVPETRRFTDPPSSGGYDLGNGTSGTYDYRVDFTRIATPAGLGQNRPAVSLNGYVGGMVRSFNNSTGQFTSSSQPLFGAMVLNLDPSNSRLQANMAMVATETGTNGFQNAAFQFGSLDTTQRARGSYVDYDNFAASGNRTVTNTTTGAQTPGPGVGVNGQSPLNQNALFVNVQREVAQQVTAGLGGNITFCQCEYTRWGFWSSDTYRSQNGALIGDRIHLGTWVAGRMPEVTEVPASGTATYVGHVVASVRAGSNEYVAGGSMTNTVNFGNRSGTAQVSGLDGTNYSGALALNQGDPRFLAASLSGSGGRSMTMVGNLFRGPSSGVGEMGGNVLMSGPNSYRGSGIFAGRMQ